MKKDDFDFKDWVYAISFLASVFFAAGFAFYMGQLAASNLFPIK